MKTQFGTSTILVRAGLTPGTIKIRAAVPGLKSDEIYIVTHPSPLTLLYTDQPSALSDNVRSKAVVRVKSDEEKDVKLLQEENTRLKQQITSKEQEIMELRSTRHQ